MKKIRVFDSPDVLATERSSLLAISNKFGLTFAGRDKTLKVFVTDDIIAAGRVSGNTNEIGTIFNESKDDDVKMIITPVRFFNLGSDRSFTYSFTNEPCEI